MTDAELIEKFLDRDPLVADLADQLDCSPLDLQSALRDQRDAYQQNRQRSLTLRTDGASRGNPGQAAAGAVIEDEDGVRDELREYLGPNKTNNEAEYEALILGLKQLPPGVEVTAYLDSELVVNQLTGEYQVNSQKLRPLHEQVRELEDRLGMVEYHAIPREENEHADRLANEALDRRQP